MLAVAESIVANHNFTVPSDLGRLGPDGNYYSRWYLLLSLLAVPFVAAGNLLAHWLHLPSHYVAAICALLLPVILTAATTSLVALLALELGSNEKGALVAALSYVFGTVAMVYARTFFTEPLLAFLTAASLYFAFRKGRRALLVVSALVGLSVLAKPTAVVLGLILAAYFFAKERRISTAAVPLIGTGVGLALYTIYNSIRFGNPLDFGPPTPFALGWIPAGLAGLTLSPSRGLIWYSPLILLSIAGFRRAAKRNALEASTIAAVLLAYLLVHAALPYWSGGWSWGPRFLLPTFPGVVALTGLLEGRTRKLLLFLALLGFLVNSPTLFSFYERYFAEATEQGVPAESQLWALKYAPAIHGWPAACRQVRDALGVDAKQLFHQRTETSHTIGQSRALRVVALWWWVLPVAGISRWVGVVFSFALCAVATWIILSLWTTQASPAT